jgi:hypothetical protein
MRLQRELADAYGSLPARAPYIDRLANDISALERDIARRAGSVAQ